MSTTYSTSNSEITFVFYHYDPNLPAAIIFAVLFALSSSFHCFQLIKTKTWFYIPMLIGGLCKAPLNITDETVEVVGYTGRALSHFNNQALGPFIMQTLLLLVAPALFAASIYMVLGRLIRFVHGEKYSLVRINWVTKVFVFGDILSFGLQATGTIFHGASC